MSSETVSEKSSKSERVTITPVSYATATYSFNNLSFDLERGGVSLGIKSTAEGVGVNLHYLEGSGFASANEESASVLSSPRQPLYRISLAGTAVKKKKLESDEQKIQFKKTFRAIVESEVFEFGVKSAAETYVEGFLKRKPVFTKNCLNELYLEFAIESDQLAIAILKVLAHSNRELLYPVADTVAIAALSHESLEVRECGVRAFEYWESISAVAILEKTRLEPEWLEDYKQEVIRNIREQQ